MPKRRTSRVMAEPRQRHPRLGRGRAPSVHADRSGTRDQAEVVAGRASRRSLSSHPSTTNSESSESAAQKVLFTAELVCGIIRRLPFEDIIASSRVCHFWRNAVAGDLRIQRALFLKPKEFRKEIYIQYSGASESFSVLIYTPETKPINSEVRTICELHPFLERIFGNFFVASDEIKPDASLYRLFPSFDHLEGSWRDMFATQPPCRRITIWATWERESDMIYPEPIGDWTDINGVRLGGLHDAVMRVSLHCLKGGYKEPFAIFPYMDAERSTCEDIEFKDMSFAADDSIIFVPEEDMWKSTARERIRGKKRTLNP